MWRGLRSGLLKGALLLVAAKGFALEAPTIADLRRLSTKDLPDGSRVEVLGYYAPEDHGGGEFRLDRSMHGADEPGLIKAEDGGGNWRRMGSSSVAVEAFGAKGDGKTDDTAAINAAVRFASMEGSRVEFRTGRVYKIGQRSPGDTSGSIDVPRGMVLDGSNCILLQCGNSGFFRARSRLGQACSLVENISAGTNRLKVDSTAGLRVGDVIWARLGQNPLDRAEPIFSLIARITAIDGNTLAMDRTVDCDISLEGATNPDNKRLWRIEDFCSDSTVQNFLLRTAPGVVANGGLNVYVAENLTFRDIVAQGNVGAGMILAQHAWHLRAERLTMEKANPDAGFGRMFSFSNCIGITGNTFVAHELNGVAAFWENDCDDVFMDNWFIEDYRPTSARTIFMASGPKGTHFNHGMGSRVRVSDVTVRTTNPVGFFDSGGQPADFQARDVNIRATKLPIALNPRSFAGRFELQLGSEKYVVNFDNQLEKTFFVSLAAPIQASFELPPGVLIDYDIFASKGYDSKQLEGLWLERSGRLGADLKGKVSAGERRWFANPYFLCSMAGEASPGTSSRMGTEGWKVRGAPTDSHPGSFLFLRARYSSWLIPAADSLPAEDADVLRESGVAPTNR